MILSQLPIQKFFANDGSPLAGGLLFTYIAGTTTKLATYTSSTGLAQNTNPIVLNFRGEAHVWLDPQLSYKFTLSPPGDTDPPTHSIWTVDNISYNTLLAGILTRQNVGQVLFPITAVEIAAGITPTNYYIPSHEAVTYIDPLRYADVLASAYSVAAQLGGGEIRLESKRYNPIGVNITASHIKFIGAKRPYFNSGGTALEDGSIIDGPLIYFANNLEFRDLGVDSGSIVCASLYSGTAQEGLACTVLNLGGQPQFFGLVVQNVVSICKDATASVHAFAVEGYTRARVDNVETLFGTHGQAYKVIDSQITNIRSRGNGSEGVVIKSDAIRQCNQSTFDGINVSQFAGETQFGINVQAQGSQEVHDVVISNAICVGMVKAGLNMTAATGTDLIRDVTVQGSCFTSNITNGVELIGKTQRVRFVGCTANTNTGFGFTDDANSDSEMFVGCIANNNASGFVHFGTNVDLDECSAANNTSYGFYAKTGASVYRICCRGSSNGTSLFGADSGVHFFNRFIADSVTAPTLLNSWVNFGAGNTAAGYWIDDAGIVYLQGLIKSGIVGSAAFQVPAGFRPPLIVRFPITSFNGANAVFGEVFVSAGGDVTPAAGSNNYLSLDGISFRTY